MNEPCKQPLESGMSAPDRNDEYLLYQTLVGALPFDCESSSPQFEEFIQRVKDYLVKAVREAKTHSNWVQPNEPYEGACRHFIDRILDRSTDNRFWADFLPFQEEVSEYGIYNSLAQTTLKMTCPGVPDFYQGSELWDLNLVDPDNRRPVDFEKRARLLKEVSSLHPSDFTLQIAPDDGRVKLFLIDRGLHARRENRDIFDAGDYLPASVAGSCSSHVVAFFRERQGRYALVVVPRFITSLVGSGQLPVGPRVWEDTRIGLPGHGPSNWQDALTGRTLHAQGEISVGDILATFPVAILLGG
jgi:(1->4)-alpha-D-glucan 1-alpha-D-glucosylmutase